MVKINLRILDILAVNLFKESYAGLEELKRSDVMRFAESNPKIIKGIENQLAGIKYGQ